jgi:hypothetical protein
MRYIAKVDVIAIKQLTMGLGDLPPGHPQDPIHVSSSMCTSSW